MSLCILIDCVEYWEHGCNLFGFENAIENVRTRNLHLCYHVPLSRGLNILGFRSQVFFSFLFYGQLLLFLLNHL